MAAGITPGMYIPLDHWKFLEKDDDIAGSKGGRVITYDNFGRYFDNTSFIGFVSNSWIGTSQSQSAVLEEVIKTVLKSGKTFTIAVKTSKEEIKKPVDDDNN